MKKSCNMVAMASWLNKNMNTLELSPKMATYLNIDVDSETIKKELSKLSDLPTPVSSWLVEIGLDSTEDEAVWVWAMLTEDEVEFVKRKELRSIITKKLRKLQIHIQALMFVFVVHLKWCKDHGSSSYRFIKTG